MKTLAIFVGIGLLGGFSLGWPPSSLANLEVSASVQIHARADFDAPLSAYGSWVEVRGHGRCWRPAGVAMSWRPYCDGRWVWTDCGWYWETDEPWGWACYHYGRWAYDSELGWFWVPDIEWAPAWVYWRVGGGFIGWAPCPPRGVVIAPPLFSFVAAGHFHERIQPASMVINDVTIINRTKEITEVKRANRTIGGVRKKVVINEGPGVAMVQKATGRELHATPIQEVARPGPLPQRESREPAKPVEKTQIKPGPETVQPSEATPDSPAKTQPQEKAPPKEEKVRPAEPPKKSEPPVVRPARPQQERGHRPDFDRQKKRGRGKDKP